MKLAFLAFTEKGFVLASSLAQTLGGSVMRCGQPDSLQEWTQKQFAQADGLVFVGALGIAVRAIAPHIQKKWKDPAVVVVDEGANFSIPLLSGHLGGANQLARTVSQICGAVPVVTTATDVNGVFAVDEWARHQKMQVQNPQNIRIISGKLLAGGTIQVYSHWPIAGQCPKGVELTQDLKADVVVSTHKQEATLLLVPQQVVLGIGCRRGTSKETIERVLQCFLQQTGLQMQAVCGVASIDLKEDEAGLLAFCQEHGWTFETRTAEQLQQVAGEFTPSQFVSHITGVDNVCERSAVAVSQGILQERKFAMDGVTMAAAIKPFSMNWNWTEENKERENKQ